MIRLFKYANSNEYTDFQNYIFKDINNLFDFANDKVTINSVEYRISTMLKSPFSSSTVVSSGGSSVGGGDNIYSTEQKHFTATPVSDTSTIVLNISTLLGETITEENFANGILKVYDDSANELKQITLDKFTWDVATKTLDVSVCTGAFVFDSTDIVNLWITGPKMGYDNSLDMYKNYIQNPDWSHYLSPEHPIEETNLAANTYFSEISQEAYNRIAIQVNMTDATGASFKLYATLDENAAVPATGGTPGNTWIEVTSDIFGGAVSGTDINKIGYLSEKMPAKYLVEYTVQNATNAVDIRIRKY